MQINNPVTSRRQILRCGATLLGVVGTLPLLSARAYADHGEIDSLQLNADQWKQRLTADEFAVLREEATEKPFSSPLNEEKRNGIYHCRGCDLPLFNSTTKFESGTGWPSFYDVIPGHIDTKLDFVLLWPRTEYHCKRCGGHQGHIFEDGPPPTGLRYCNNGVALRFVPS